MNAINAGEVKIGVDVALALLEWAAKVGPYIYDAIQSNGDYTPEQKAALIARVKAAREAVAAYEPLP